MLIRLRVSVGGASEARQVSERLSDPDEDGTEAMATSAFEDTAQFCWQVDAYYDEPPAPETVLRRIGDLLQPGATTSIDAVPDVNWVAVSQAALPPVNAGRFLVHGSHDRSVVGRRRFALEIDAGEAFGTAHHATTQGCLEALDQVSRRRQFARILDLGCGSGVLAIAAARIFPSAAIAASDIDPVAVEVAAANVALNGARGRIRLLTAGGLSHGVFRARQPFDLVLANILAGPLIRLAPALARAIEPGGVAILSGILGEQAREVIAVYEMAGFRLKQRRTPYNWATLVLVRRAGPSNRAD